MIVNKALTAAAVLLFTTPVVPALAHDDYGYIRCLECPPGNWVDGYRWRHWWRPHYWGNYWWRHHYWRPYHDGGWRYGGWRY